MPNLNKVFLMGHLTRDPDMRYTPKGTAVGELGLAVNSSYKTADGQTKEEVCFVSVVVWGRQAETCKEYLFKGSPAFVEGRMIQEEWESNGEKKSKTRVRAERVQFLSSPNRAATKPPANEPPSDGTSEDDIPF